MTEEILSKPTMNQNPKTCQFIRLIIAFMALTSALTPVDLLAQPNKLVISRYDQLSSNANINSIYIDPNNTIYVATTNGVKIIRNISDPSSSSLQDQNIVAVTSDRKYGAYAASTHAIYAIPSEEKIMLPESSAKISCLAVIKSRIWIGTDHGVYIYSIAAKVFEHKNMANSELKSDKINFMVQDKEGIIWLGTGAGEMRIDDDKWKSYHSDFDVINYYENKEGLWFIGNNDMWLVDYFNREYKVGLDEELYSGALNDFAIDSKGKLYVASDKLVRYDPYTETIEKTPEDAGIVSKKCTSIACDQNDNIWIGTNGAGLYRLVFGDQTKNELTATCLLVKEISCSDRNDAEIKVNVSGGKEPYTYAWSNSSLRGGNPKNIEAGEYTVTVTDQFQNKYITYITVNSQPPLTIELADSRRISAPNKKDGALEVKASGGVGPLTYFWSTGDKTSRIERLKAGDYTITVTDAHKCDISARYTVAKEKFIPQLDMALLKVGETLRMNELYFKADSTEVSPESFQVLDEVLAFLKVHNSVIVEIGGHTNTIPPHEYCDKLSTDRARNVAAYFYDAGIPPNRLSYKGYGKRSPISNSDSLEGRRKNQRVEIKILGL